MAVITHLTSEDIANIIILYPNFPKLVNFQGIAEGVENSNFLLEFDNSADVSQPAKAILTIFEQRVKASDVPLFIELMENLYNQQINCPRAYSNKDNQQIINIHNKPAAIFEFLEGKAATNHSNMQLYNAGAMMAHLHLKSEHSNFHRKNTMDYNEWCRIYDKIMNKPHNQLYQISSHLGELIKDELAFQSKVWHDADDKTKNNLPYGVIHADYFPDNVFFHDNGKSDEVSAIIDFYFACNGYYIYDIAIALNAWCSERYLSDNGEKQLYWQYSHDKEHHFISGYNSIRKLTENEIKSLNSYQRAASLRFLLTRCHDLLYHDDSHDITPKNPMEYQYLLEYHRRNL